MGAKGVYFDNKHGNRTGVFGTTLQNRYVTQNGGANLPSAQADNDAKYLRYLSFNAKELANAINYIIREVKSTHPNFKFIVSCENLGILTDPLMHSSLATLADAPKTEFRLAVRPGLLPQVVLTEMRSRIYADITTRQAYGLNLMRTASQSMPHVWSGGFANDKHTEGFIASVIAMGGIAAFDIEDQFVLGNVPNSRGLTEANVVNLVALGKRISRGLKNLSPMRYAAVYHSEEMRDAHGANHLNAWNQVIAPPLLVFQELTHWGVPTDVLTDDMIKTGDLSGYSAIFVSDLNALPQAQKNRLTAFQSAGGIVYNIGINIGSRTLQTSTQTNVNRVRNNSPIKRDEKVALQTSIFTNAPRSRITLATTNDISWLQELEGGDYLNFTPWGYEFGPARTPNSPPNLVHGVVVQVKNSKPVVKVTDHYTGLPVSYRPIIGGIEVTLPDFRYGSVIEIDY
jgi:hypothetical protein